jgi:hypothetical protein
VSFSARWREQSVATPQGAISVRSEKKARPRLTLGIRLTFLNSAQCLMVRRWRLIGYFPILYNPAGRDKMGSPALQHFNDKILLRACVCFQGVTALRTSGQAPCKPQQVCSLSLVALQTTLHDCGSIVLNRVLWRATNDRARTGFFVDWRSWLAWSSYSLSGWCISTGFSPQSSLKCSCKRTHPTHPTPRRQRVGCVCEGEPLRSATTGGRSHLQLCVRLCV